MKRLLFFLFALLPQLALAQTTTEEAAEQSGLTFTPPDTDVSVNYLGTIFGYVDGVLHGTGSQIIGTMFGVFNSAVLALGMFVLAYVTIVGVLKTAGEGSPLGKQWSSIWVPIKASLGVALLIPKASGYCAMQILVMFIVLQGIGVADAVWTAALGYLAKGGVIVQQSESAAEQDAEEVLQVAASIMASQVCMHSLEDQLQKYLDDGKASAYTTVPAFNGTIKIDNDARNVLFPGDLSTYEGLEDLQGACGEVTWEPPILPGWITELGDEMEDAMTQQINDSKGLAVYQMVLDLDPYAQQVVQNSYRSSDERIALGYLAKPDTADNTSQEEWGSGDETKAQTLLQGRELNDAAADYLNIMFPAVNALNRSFSDIEFIGQAIGEGWIMAGKYYFDMAALNEDADDTKTNNTNIKASPPPANFTDTKSEDSRVQAILEAFGGTSSTYLEDLNKLVNNSDLGQIDPGSLKAPPGTYLGDGINYEITYGHVSTKDIDKQMKKIKMKKPKGNRFEKELQKISNKFTKGAMKIVKMIIGDLVKAQATNANPVMIVAGIGYKLMGMALAMWLGATLLSVGGAAAAASVPIIGIGYAIAIGVLTNWMVPLLLAPAAAMMGAGLMMAYYVPLIPFIVFTFAAIGWFIAVIESMAAAPIVAMGIIWPEGHEIFGKADQALLLIVNVFVRPSLMVLGLFFGIILSYAMVWLLNMGFFYSFLKAVTGAKFSSTMMANPLGLLIFIAVMIIVYMMLVMTIINKSFSLIHVLPDKIMRWLSGGTQEAFGAEAAQAAEQVRGGVTGGAQAAAGAQEAMTKGIAEGTKADVQAAAQRKAQKGKKETTPQDDASKVQVGKGPEDGGDKAPDAEGGKTPSTGGGGGKTSP